MTEGVIETAGLLRGRPETPYVGLVPYGENDAPFFFGREDERAVVTANLRAARLTVLYGPSGVGKSSLLLAGVVPDLRALVERHSGERHERAPFAICVFRTWRDEPLPALVEAIRLSVVEALGGEQLPPWQQDQPVVATLRSWTTRVRTLLVVLDQFEDSFLYQRDGSGPGTFDAEFPAIVNEPNLRANVLLSIREDAWAKLDRFEGRLPQVFDNYVRVEHLNRNAAQQAIEGPIGVWNSLLPSAVRPYTIEKKLVEAVVDAAASGRLALAEGAGAAPAEPGAATDSVEAPFLQLVMDRLWRATLEADSHALTLERLHELGGAQQIVDSHLVDVLGALQPAEQAVAADLFRFLVTRSKTKIAHSASDLAEWTKRPEADVLPVLEQLCRGESGRILRAIAGPPGDPEGTRFELFHDVLAEPIVEWRKSYEQAREREELAAQLEAEELARREEEAQRQRERRQRLVRFSALGLLVLVGVLAALSAVAVFQWRSSVSQKHRANSLLLADLSRSKLNVAPVRSVFQAALAVDEKPTPEAESALENALATTHLWGRLDNDDGQVLDATFSPNGTLVATATANGVARIWNVATRQDVAVLEGHQGAIRSIAFDTDGTRVVTGGKDGTARIWGIPSGKSLAVLRPTRSFKVDADVWVPYVRAAFSPDGSRVLMTGPDGGARVWDVATGRQVLIVRLPRADAVINDATFSPNGRRIAVASDDGTAQIWSIALRRKIATTPAQGGSVLSADFSPDGKRLVTLSKDTGTVHIWNAANGRPRAKLAAFPNGLYIPPSNRIGYYYAVFSPNGARIAIVGSGRAKLWDGRSHHARKLVGPQRILGAAFNADGTRLVTTQYNGTVRIWDVRTGANEAILRGHKGRVYVATFSPSGSRIVTGSTDGTALLWTTGLGRRLGEVRMRRRLLTSGEITSDGKAILAIAGGRASMRALGDAGTVALPGEPAPVSDAAVNPAGTLVATADREGVARIWNLRGRYVATLRGHRGWLSGVAFSPDGRLLATVGPDVRFGSVTVQVWKTSGWKRVSILRQHGFAYSTRVAFSPDSRLVATASDGAATHVWDVRSGRSVQIRSSNDVSVTFSPDSSRILTANPKTGAEIWDLASRKPVSLPRAFAHPAYAAVFTPDGERVVTAGRKGVVTVWQLPTGMRIRQWRGDKDGISSAAFSPDGRLVATGGRKGVTRIWELATGRPIATTRSLRGEVISVRFSSDGKLLVLAGGDGARIWAFRTNRTPTIVGRRGDITSALVSSNRRLALTLSEGQARMWDLTNGHTSMLGQNADATSIAISSDGRRMATGHYSDFSSDKVRLWQATGARLGKEIKAPVGVVNVSLNRDGTLVAVAGDDETVRIWRTGTPKAVSTLRGHTEPVNDMQFSLDGRFVVTASDDKTAVIWTIGGSSVRVLRGNTGPVKRASFSPDGKLVLTTSGDGTVRVWDARTGGNCAVITSSAEPIVGARFVGRDNAVLTVSADGSVRSQPAEACTLAIHDDFRRVAQRLLDALSHSERSALMGSS